MSLLRRIKISKVLGNELEKEDKIIYEYFDGVFSKLTPKYASGKVYYNHYGVGKFLYYHRNYENGLYIMCGFIRNALKGLPDKDICDIIKYFFL